MSWSCELRNYFEIHQQYDIEWIPFRSISGILLGMMILSSIFREIYAKFSRR